MSASGLTPQAMYAASAGLSTDRPPPPIPQPPMNNFIQIRPEITTNFLNTPPPNMHFLHNSPNISILGGCNQFLPIIPQFYPNVPNIIPILQQNFIDQVRNPNVPIEPARPDLKIGTKKTQSSHKKHQKYLSEPPPPLQQARTNFAPIKNLQNLNLKGKPQRSDYKNLSSNCGLPKHTGQYSTSLLDQTKLNNAPKLTMTRRKSQLKFVDITNSGSNSSCDYEDYFKSAFSKPLHEMKGNEIDDFVKASTFPLVAKSRFDKTKFDVEVSKVFHKLPSEMSPPELVQFMNGFNSHLVPLKKQSTNDATQRLLGEHSYAQPNLITNKGKKKFLHSRHQSAFFYAFTN